MSAPLDWLLYGETPRCGCTGECGRDHAAGGCDVTHPAALVNEPRDPAAVAVTPLSVRPEDMGVWCSDCHAMAASDASARTRLRVLVAAACHKPSPDPGLSVGEGTSNNQRGAAA